MDTLKGQDNDEIKELCSKNECGLVIVPHNLTNKFQPFAITINQKAKKFISHKFNTWHGDRVHNQLKSSVAPGNAKVSLKISDSKLLRARWIVEMYDYLKQQKGSILHGFDKAGILETFKSANKIFTRIENPFTEKRALLIFFRVAFFLMKKTIEIFKYMCYLIIVDYCSLFVCTILTEIVILFFNDI